MTHDRDELITVAKFLHPYQADVARARLAADGIEAVVYDDQTAITFSLATGVRLQVKAADEARAKEILDELDAAIVEPSVAEPAEFEGDEHPES